jgi:hypothetical protein
MVPEIKHIQELVLKTIVIIIMVTGLSSLPCHGQKDTLKNYKNTVSINISNPMLFGSKYNVIGYERVIKDHQTVSGSIGRFAFPKFVDLFNDSVGIKNEYHDHGFHLSFDYRFYLKKQNKYSAPRGIYLGPYYAFNYLTRELTWDLNTSTYTGEVKSDMDLMANLIGVQLGYQFVFWDRLSIDIILAGPGAWIFNLKTDFNTDLPPEDNSMLLDELNKMLKERFPGSDIVIQGGEFEASRVTSTASMGFRYMVNIGFRF